MIDKGANPFIVAYNGTTWADRTRHLSKLPTTKSVYFLTRPLEGNDVTKVDFCDPWFYRNGVFTRSTFSLMKAFCEAKGF